MLQRLLIIILLCGAHSVALADAAGKKLIFNDTDYFLRWSKQEQFEFTPAGQEDLNTWKNLITINFYNTIHDSKNLNMAANVTLDNYKNAGGKILRAYTMPGNEKYPDEHVVAAVFSQPDFTEYAIARFVMYAGDGISVVYSHRLYGKDSDSQMSKWLEKNVALLEKALLSVTQIPDLRAPAKEAGSPDEPEPDNGSPYYFNADKDTVVHEKSGFALPRMIANWKRTRNPWQASPGDAYQTPYAYKNAVVSMYILPMDSTLEPGLSIFTTAYEAMSKALPKARENIIATYQYIGNQQRFVGFERGFIYPDSDTSKYLQAKVIVLPAIKWVIKLRLTYPAKDAELYELETQRIVEFFIGRNFQYLPETL